jgi:hypothetical protein
MVNLKSLQANVPKANLEDYTIVCYGRPKAGKTTLYFELLKEHFNGDLSKGLLLGFERGYKALSGLFAVDIEQWEDFQDVVEQLIEDKAEVPYRWIALDTLDELYKFATDYVVKQRKIADRKPYKVINDIPFGAGYELVSQEISKQINKLTKGGFGLFCITHDKEKRFESREGVAYDQVTVALPTRAKDLFVNQADFIVFIDIAKEKNDTGGFRDVRYIYFRAEGSDIMAGSRFKNVPTKIPYDAKQFLAVFRDAVLEEFGGDVKKLESAKEKQSKEREEKANEYIESEKGMSDEDMMKFIGQAITDMNDAGKDSIKNKFQEAFGTIDFKRAMSREQLQQAVQMVKG